MHPAAPTSRAGAHTGDVVASTLAAYAAYPDRYANGWDAFDPATDASIDLVALAVDTIPVTARILDVGSGSGRDLRRLRSLGYQDAIGVDAPPELAARASRFAPVLVADMRALPLPDRSVDVILAAASLLHLPLDDGRRALTEFARVLRPGGRVVISVKAGERPTVDPHGRYFHLYADAELDTELEKAGFTITTRATDTDRRGTTWLVRTATA